MAAEGIGKAPSLSELGEFGLIRRLSALLPESLRPGEVGIGDDAAVIRLGDRTLLATTDALLEGVHFRRDWTPPDDLGWKALAVNLSDIAAMGGEPRFALISLGLTADADLEWIESFYRGMADLARESECAVIGGDTIHSPDRIYLNLTVIGEAPEGRYVTRSGARPGDRLLVTGALGESLAGYYALKSAGERSDSGGAVSEEGFPAVPEGVRACIRKHFRPVPRLNAGRAAARTGFVHAMMDVSDGLTGDVRHLAERSGVGIRICLADLPLSDALREAAPFLGKDAVDLALAGGEDYELLMAVPPKHVEAVRESVESTGVPFTAIGVVTDRPGEIVQVHPDGQESPLPLRSWDHFRG
ncbi:MAG: thiamine-phosphate kinase [Armatimonadetes bacterium]|nr:thiamine-phosphate kinase [Armatimonadota bacterium]